MLSKMSQLHKDTVWNVLFHMWKQTRTYTSSRLQGNWVGCSGIGWREEGKIDTVMGCLDIPNGVFIHLQWNSPKQISLRF